MPEPIRVLVVDDSHFMCRAITRMIKADSGLEVVGVAHDGREALAAMDRLSPDVVTMDVEMPVMGGLEVLRALAGRKAPPVIVLSSITQAGSAIAVDALELGAFDLVAKPDRLVEVFGVAAELQAKIRAAHESRRKKRRPPSSQTLEATAAPKGEIVRTVREPVAASRDRQDPTDLIVIGVSTGGPGTLQAFVPHVPADFPIPIVIAQHMPPGFTRSLAERLDSVSQAQVREAVAGDCVQPGQILIAPAGWHLLFERGDDGVRVVLQEDTGTFSWYRPSVDTLFESAAEVYGSRTLALVLTGLGSDGTKGAAAVKARGGIVWAQDEESSVVYGMPRAVKEAGLVDRVLSLPAIGPAMRRLGFRARRDGSVSGTGPGCPGDSAPPQLLRPLVTQARAPK